MSSQARHTTTTQTRADRWGFTWEDWFWRSMARRVVLVRASGSGAASKDTYHTDYDCPRTSQASKLLVKPLYVLAGDIEHCAYCSDSVEATTPSRDHLNSLLAAAEATADD